APHLLMREEPESQRLIEEVFEKEGIQLHSGCKPAKAWQTGGQIHILCACGRETSGSHLLLAAGRAPTLSSLDLDAAHVGYTPKGILVDRYGRTNQKNIWAVGDCTGQTPFTHMAEFNGRHMLWNLLVPRLFWKKWHEPDDTPRVTYTDPEIAAMGLSEAEALKKYGPNKIKVYTFPFSKLDRALTTGRSEGFVKVVTKKWSSKILGATVAAPRAGEMLLELSTAMFAGLPLRKLAEIVHPYPTYAQAIRKTADLWLTETLLPELKKWTGKN
ncbi:MAG: FAD-dependent oxidoreductase, partial [Chlamydiia bacterium]|nr:FAD-dependent oxidoreductase [Chlamydiia bacterium]